MARKSKLTFEDPRALIEVTCPDGVSLSIAFPELQTAISLLDSLKDSLDTKAQTLLYKVTDSTPEVAITAKLEIEGLASFWRQSLSYAIQDKNLNMDWKVNGFWREVEVYNIPALRIALINLTVKRGVTQLQVTWA
jgi:hypothetical protein